MTVAALLGHYYGTMKKDKQGGKQGVDKKVDAAAASTKRLLLLSLIWAALMALTVIVAGCPRFTAYYAAFVLLSLALAGGQLLFARRVSRGAYASLPAFKKLVGYGLVAHYAACALPRVDWANSGHIGHGRVVFMFVMCMLCLVAGLALFLYAGRAGVWAALGLITEEELADPKLRRKRRGERPKSFVHGALEWVDALAFAAILVIIIDLFAFQLYVIPSESMVPAFLVRDRPLSVKFIAGPRIPLTEWRLPFIKLPKRGDVVTIANPRYPENSRVDLKKYLAQFVSMLTFTAVNIDRDAQGMPKADPLVKRVVGLPGEKLMMVDDVVYARREGESDWSVVEADKSWAHVDLWKLPAELRAKIRDIRIDENLRSVLDSWDKRRRETDTEALAARLSVDGKRILARAMASAPLLMSFESREIARVSPGIASRRDAYIAKAALGGRYIIGSEGTEVDDLPLLFALIRSERLREDFAAYASPPVLREVKLDPYAQASRALNLLIKKNLLDRIERCIDLAGSGVAAFAADVRYLELERESRELRFYLSPFFEMRNFPEFPQGDSFLAADEYFAMGDNRYNSLDFRNALEDSPRLLDPSDPESLRYMSFVKPFALNLRYIEGYAVFRVWPPSRIGAVR